MYRLSLLIFILNLFFGFFLVNEVCSSDYTAVPPFCTANVKSNVLLVMDYSGSMQGPANYGTDWGSYHQYDNYWESDRVANYGDGILDSSDYYWNYYVSDYVYREKVNESGPTAEVKVEYDNSTVYYGYFESKTYYDYNNDGFWEETNKPSDDDNIGDANHVSGNLLNFLIMSRMDCALKSLIGGKAEYINDTLTLKSQGGGRYVEVTNLDLVAYIRPQGRGYNHNYQSTTYSNNIMVDVVDISAGSSKIGEFAFRQGNVKIDENQRKGIIQENFDKVRFGFIPYSTSLDWPIKHGVHNADRDNLITELEETIPYNGTPTGEALREAYRYLRQSDLSKQNSYYEDLEGGRDPYYQENLDGEQEAAWCRKSFVVLISDGEWTAGNNDPVKPAYKLHTEDLRTSDEMKNRQKADIYSLFAFSDTQNGENSMQTVAAFGNFKEIYGCSSDWPYTFDGYPTNSKDVEFPRSNCDPTSDTYKACCSEWDDIDKNGIPDAYFNAADGQEMALALTRIFSEINQQTASGTTISALAQRAASGSIVNQAVFYPEKEFQGGDKIDWLGYLYSYWMLNRRDVENLREDTNENKKLDILTDFVMVTNSTDAGIETQFYNSYSNGSMKERVSADGRNSLDQIRPLWEAGEKLWNRSFSSRIIYGVDENGDLSSFKSTNKDSFDSLLGTNATLFPDCLMDGSDISYTNLIDFVRGKHISGCRNREIDGNTWKLGDIVYSTPLTVDYYNSTMVYVAANDGMLHAFRLGKIRALYSDLQKAQLCQSRGDCGVDKLGSEEWAFLPKDVMPYLRFQAQSNYNHMYLHDMRPYLIEYEDSSGDVRKILIGGMRFGGACGTGDIKPPNDTAPVGRSAYYALDITDPQSPEYLWSFSPDNLGFSYSGPAYIKRKNDDPLVDKEWNRYVMFASGPNDYDGTSDQSLRIYTVDLLEGPSGYNCTIGPDEPDLANLNNAFGGRLFTDGLDVNKDGQTDFVLLGYTSKADDLSGMNGGVLKIYTGPVDGDEVKPANWDYEAFLGSSVQAPITASIKSMACFPDEIDFPYLYFGTGRYFIPNDDASKKDNHFFGVPFVYNATNKRIAGSSNISQIGDSSSMTCSALEDVNESPNSGSWKIPLRSAEGSYLRERCYSEATITDLNIISFNTAQPTAAVCGFGGRTWPWAINCATGRSIEYGLCEHGKYTVDEKDKEAFAIFVQTSTGAVSKRTSGDFDTSGRSKNPIAGTPSPDSSLFVPKGGSDLDILYWREW